MAGSAEITARDTECPPPIVQHAGKESVQLDTAQARLSAPPYGGFMFPVLRLHTPTRFAMALVASVIASLAQSADAEEPLRAFLHAAQDQGYGEIAIDYLQQQSARGSLPPSLAETMDLELARSYRVAVGEAYNAPEAEARLAKAQIYLEKFLKEHPDHSEVARAMESWGDIALDRALQRMRLAAATRDPAQKAKYLTPARADLEEARPRFSEATARYAERYAALKSAAESEAAKRPRNAVQPTKKQRQTEGEETERPKPRGSNAGSNCPSSISISHRPIWIARRPHAKPRLEAAAKAFDGIFQSYRENLVGLHAHMWNGRAADEMGADQLALDIYDEVLSTSPEGRERETGLEPLFALVQYYRMLVVLRKDGVKEFLPQAHAWMEANPTWKKLDGFQGIKLEVAKATLRGAAELSGSKKTSAERTALTMLSEIGRTHGEHQQEALLLRREHVKSDPQDMTAVKTFDEAMAARRISRGEPGLGRRRRGSSVRVGVDVDDQRPAASGRRSNASGPCALSTLGRELRGGQVRGMPDRRANDRPRPIR